MKLGMMQPYFFPYLGYFDLIFNSDKWVIFDTDNYKRHGWINRNRILHPSQGWQYITVPLSKASIHADIRDIDIKVSMNWQSRILGQIEHYRKEAPFFQATLDLVKDCLRCETKSISILNTLLLDKVCDFLSVDFNYSYYSEMDLRESADMAPGDWALETAIALGAESYINPPGGEKIFEEAKFNQAGIGLEIKRLPTFQYEVGGYEFEPDLSIIDVLMWNSPQEVRDYLEKHKSAALETREAGA